MPRQRLCPCGTRCKALVPKRLGDSRGKRARRWNGARGTAKETATSSSLSLTENVQGCEISGENAERVASSLLVCRYLRVAGLGARTLD